MPDSSREDSSICLQMYAIWNDLVSFTLECSVFGRDAGYPHNRKLPQDESCLCVYFSDNWKDGPATANYDEDLGTLPLSEWYYKPGFELNEQAQHSQRGPPVPDNILVNGTHVNANGGGSYFKMKVTKVRVLPKHPPN